MFKGQDKRVLSQSTWPRKCAGRQASGRSYERKGKDTLKCLLEQKDPGQEEKPRQSRKWNTLRKGRNSTQDSV